MLSGDPAAITSLAQGQDCFGAFMEWGLPKEALREIWALVAGSQGQLDKHQFVSALYLMDSVKKARWAGTGLARCQKQALMQSVGVQSGFHMLHTSARSHLMSHTLHLPADQRVCTAGDEAAADAAQEELSPAVVRPGC